MRFPARETSRAPAPLGFLGFHASEIALSKKKNSELDLWASLCEGLRECALQRLFLWRNDIHFGQRRDKQTTRETIICRLAAGNFTGNQSVIWEFVWSWNSIENNRRFSAENTLKSKYSLKNHTCCVFAVFLSLFRASGGRFGRFSA